MGREPTGKRSASGGWWSEPLANVELRAKRPPPRDRRSSRTSRAQVWSNPRQRPEVYHSQEPSAWPRCVAVGPGGPQALADSAGA